MRFLKDADVAEWLGISVETLKQWRYRDRGDQAGRSPKWVEVNGRCIGYRQSAVEEWLTLHETGGAA